ncbi:hypothetical protein CDAR_14531 [Caerostris darwini]|uniref:Uncharacterized protein n=1 Tax=Caerostris darwini TaxID=1538125 RepID=A0AAV4TWK6_9ARAC|nr:hypothetical protein CDAR_14531 [Caerostris darwini]
MSEISNIFYESFNEKRRLFEKYDNDDDYSELQNENLEDNSELENDDGGKILSRFQILTRLLSSSYSECSGEELPWGMDLKGQRKSC